MEINKKTKKPLLISHRGAHREAPENSCAGFEIALAQGVDGIETDVQLTRDGVPVLFHDPTTSRITGQRKRISAYTCAELKTLVLKHAGTEAAIPTLAEVLERFSRRTALLLEIKSRKPDRISGRSRELTDKVVAAIAGLPARVQDSIRVLSFDPDVLARANRVAPQVKCVLNTDGTGSWCVPHTDLLNNRVTMDYLCAICLDKKQLSAEAVAWAHKRGMEILTYCCNSRPQVERALNLGVDGIMSDKPGWLVEFFKLNDRRRGT